MNIEQISVFVENKRGRLAEITEVLAKAGVDIRALSIADTSDFGILRLIVDQPEKAEKALKDGGFTVSITEVLAIGVEDVPGAFSHAMRVIADANVSVEYMYSFVSRTGSRACVILRTEDREKAVEAFRLNGVLLLKQDEIEAVR